MDESNEFSGSRNGKDIYVVFMITPLLFFRHFSAFFMTIFFFHWSTKTTEFHRDRNEISARTIVYFKPVD